MPNNWNGDGKTVAQWMVLAGLTVIILVGVWGLIAADDASTRNQIIGFCTLGVTNVLLFIRTNTVQEQTESIEKKTVQIEEHKADRADVVKVEEKVDEAKIVAKEAVGEAKVAVEEAKIVAKQAVDDARNVAEIATGRRSDKLDALIEETREQTGTLDVIRKQGNSTLGASLKLTAALSREKADRSRKENDPNWMTHEEAARAAEELLAEHERGQREASAGKKGET